MKVLFISANLNSKQNGGSICSKRNYDSFVSILGKENVLVYNLIPFSLSGSFFQILKQIFTTIIRIFTLSTGGFNSASTNEIMLILRQQNPDVLFIDSSLGGKFIRKLKKNSVFNRIEVISFFHNIEFSFIWQEFILGKFWYFPRLVTSYVNENLTCTYSDRIISLTNRDNRLCQKYYSRKVDKIIPISITDRYNFNKDIKVSKKSCLFIGSNFYANIHGIKWFIKNVLPHIDITLNVAGKNLDKNKLNSEKVNVYSNIDNLEELYQRSNIVIVPLFKGGGMKVKVAEALMYGKTIFGTPEAFEGYDLDFNMVGGICNNSYDFIKKITLYLEEDPHHFNKYSRSAFLNKYSFDITLNHFRELLNV